MCRVTRVGVLFVGVLVISVVGCASAWATTAGWMVNGSQLTGTAALATTAAVDQKIELLAPEAGVTIICNNKTLNSASPTINGSNEMGSATSLELTECANFGPCGISAGGILLTQVLIDLTLDGTLATKGRFLPLSKNFATIKFEGAECGIAGVQPVSGGITFLMPTGQDERTLQLITFTNEEPGSVKVGKDSAEFKGSFLVRLASGLPFSFL